MVSTEFNVSVLAFFYGETNDLTNQTPDALTIDTPDT